MDKYGERTSFVSSYEDHVASFEGNENSIIGIDLNISGSSVLNMLSVLT